MQIKHGLLNGQVLQRDRQQRGHAKINGTCSSAGIVEWRALKGRSPVRGCNWQKGGRAGQGVFSCRVSGLPVGGPYTIDIRIVSKDVNRETISVKTIYVGDVWFLAGQSNMQGCGNMEDAPKPHPLVRCFYMRDEWDIAAEPVHFLGEAVDEVHHPGTPAWTVAEAAHQRTLTPKGVGVGVFFGREMLKRAKGVPQGLVACAHGGTSMAQWSPALKDKGGASLYGAMVRRFQKLGQPIAGMLWYQGCSEAGAPEHYAENMVELVKHVRADFQQPRLPWITVQIGRVVGEGWPALKWNSVQDQQRQLVKAIPILEVVPAADLELDDMIHISSMDYPRLAARMARMADRLVYGNRKEAGSIRIKGIKLIRKRTPRRFYEAIEVSFANVVGGLKSAGRPTGFSLLINNERPISPFFKTVLSGDRAVLEISFGGPVLESAALMYGYGTNPYINLTDERDMAVPIAGPIPIMNRKGTFFVTRWEVCRPESSKLDLATMSFPAEARKTEGWSPATTLMLADVPGMIMPSPIEVPRNGDYLFRTSIKAARALSARLALGADSPIRLWVNGAALLHIPDATNPCVPDQYEHPVDLREGDNEIVVAFDSRSGQGWGFSVRFVPADGEKQIPDGVLTWPA